MEPEWAPAPGAERRGRFTGGGDGIAWLGMLGSSSPSRDERRFIVSLWHPVRVLTHSHAPRAAMRVQTWESATRRGCCVCPTPENLCKPKGISLCQVVKLPGHMSWSLGVIRRQGITPGCCRALGTPEGTVRVWRRGELTSRIRKHNIRRRSCPALVRDRRFPAETFPSHQRDCCPMGQCEVEGNVLGRGLLGSS